MIRRRSGVVAALIATTLLLLGGTPARAADDAVDPRIVAVLAEVSGGVILDSDHAVWPELQMEMTVPSGDRKPGLDAVGSCSSGRVCAFTGYSLGGAQLSWSSCGTVPVPSSFTVRSIADARSSGSLRARNGSTVLATAYAGGWANVASGPTTNLWCTV